MNVNDLEPGTIVKRGVAKWEVVAVETEEVVFGDEKIVVKMEIANPGEDGNMMPDEGTVETVDKDELETHYEIVE